MDLHFLNKSRAVRYAVLFLSARERQNKVHSIAYVIKYFLTNRLYVGTHCDDSDFEGDNVNNKITIYVYIAKALQKFCRFSYMDDRL